MRSLWSIPGAPEAASRGNRIVESGEQALPVLGKLKFAASEEGVSGPVSQADAIGRGGP